MECWGVGVLEQWSNALVGIGPSTPRKRDAILTERNTPILQYSITPLLRVAVAEFEDKEPLTSLAGPTPSSLPWPQRR
jgi:hypothetical protein